MLFDKIFGHPTSNNNILILNAQIYNFSFESSKLTSVFRESSQPKCVPYRFQLEYNHLSVKFIYIFWKLFVQNNLKFKKFHDVKQKRLCLKKMLCETKNPCSKNRIKKHGFGQNFRLKSKNKIGPKKLKIIIL